MRKLWAAIVITAVCTSALALDISVKATVNDNRVPMGSAVQYTITVSGVQDLQPPQLPAMDGFDVRYTGPATRVAVINNSYSVEQSFNYLLIPLKEGKFTLPSVPVNIKGLTVTTEPIEIEVLPAGSASPASAPSADPADQQQDIQNRLKLLVSAARNTVYEGEGVLLTLRLYVNQLSMQDLSFPEITQDGFKLDPFSEPKQFQEVLQGINWHVVEFTTVVYPSRTGELVISPAVVRGSLLFKSRDRDESGNIFDQGFFSNFFSSYQKRQVTITSRALKLNVLPLPAEGRPADFSGAVGQYDLAVEAAPLKVKAGDPVTLRMALTGVGDLKSVRMPVFNAPGFKLYDPQIKDDAGRKTLEQVIIPTDTKITSIPAVKFSYFDTTAGAYRTIEKGPFPLEVTAPASGEEFQAVGFSQPSLITTPETIGRDIVFVKDSPGRLQKRAGKDMQDVIFYVLLAIYLQVWGGFLAFYLYRQRLLNDPRFARQVSAARQAYKMLQAARDRLRSGHTKPFYDVLESAMREYFVQRFELPPGCADAASIGQILRDRKVEEKYILLMEDIFAAAEQVRFAGMAVSDDRMRTHLADAEDIVRAVERRVR